MVEIKGIDEIIMEISPYYKKKKEPEAKHTLTYESYADTLEPVYYFLLDLIRDFGYDVEKLIDTFSPSEGSSYFSEMGQRLTVMQKQGSELMQSIGVITRSVLNIIYDLKEFKIRLQSYDDLKSKDKITKEGAHLSLKRIWIDKVDSLKGGSSINSLAMGQLGFQTLIDAFMAVKSVEDIKKLDLNERVQRILLQRIPEFNIWVEQSEKELRKRYEIEKTWLKSQVNSLKLYSRWARPFLRAAQQLEAKDPGRSPDLVKAFNRVVLELTILGKSKIKPKELALSGEFPSDFADEKFAKRFKRTYYNCLLLSFNFRAVPQQGTFIGRVDVTFRAYSLNEDEIKKLDEELNKSDLDSALALVEGTTGETLSHLKDELEDFLNEVDKKEEKEKSKDNSNPFMALFGKYEEKETKKSKDKKEIVVRPDDWYEKNYLRAYSAKTAVSNVYAIFDVYKKAHGMVSFT